MLRARAQLLVGAALLIVAALLIGGGALPPSTAVAPTPNGTIVGRVAVAHQDGAKPTDSRMIPLVETAAGPVALRLPAGLPVAPGTRVSIRNPRYDGGAIIGGDIAKLGPPTVVENDATAGPANFRPGPRTTLVLLATVAGQPAPGSVDAIRNIIFTAPNSVNSFIQEETYGQISLTGKSRSDGDVYGPYPVASNPSVTGCDSITWGKQAEQEFMQATGQNAETWDEVIVVFQFPFSQCAFTGEGEIGDLAPTGGARHAWINAVLTNGVPTTSVVAHELGHNLGVDHAGGLECTDPTTQARVAFNATCVANMAAQLPNQYLDPFDVMGTGAHEENAYHRWESGWLPSASVQTVTRSGTYLLAPEEMASSAVQLLEVPRGVGFPSYWLDFRQPFGSWFDNFSPLDPAVNGVAIRYANSSTMEHPSKSWLIDTTPDTPTFADAPLSVGNTYTDAAVGVSITTLAVSPLGALVHITVANGDDTTPPSAPTGLSATRVASGVQLSWSPASDDSGTVQHYLVRRNGAQVADVYATSAIDTAPLVGRTSEYEVYPVDPAGNVGPDITIQVTISDVTPPSAPSSLVATVSGSSVELTWLPATDDAGVASYEVDRDGQAIATGVAATSYTDVSAAPGTHTYAVRAFDAAGNAGAYATVTITEVAAAATPPQPTVTRLRSVGSLKLKRLGKHRVLVSWKAQKGAHRYEVLRGGGKKPVMLATVKRTQYTDGHAPVGKLTMKRYVVRAVLPS